MNYTTCFNCNSEHIEIADGMTLCKDCGFYTMKGFNVLSKNYYDKPKTEFDGFLKSQPLLVQSLKLYDETQKLYWIPFILNVYPVGIIYPNGTSLDNWKWCFSVYKPIQISERSKYPNPNKPGEFFEYNLDIENETQCESFGQALEYLK